MSAPTPAPSAPGAASRDPAEGIAEEAAAKVLTANNLTPEPEESALVALGWELGEGLAYEPGLRQFAKEVILISGPTGPDA